jgi:hypothetical protein
MTELHGVNNIMVIFMTMKIVTVLEIFFIYEESPM